jgi:cell division protein ZapA (FtsZ GTPase activity inhibitor)
MAHVIVQVNGRPYTMQCPDGEEEHLRDLAKLLDTEVARVRASVGSVGDIRLLVMAARNTLQTEMREQHANFIARLDSASKRLLGLAQDIDG